VMDGVLTLRAYGILPLPPDRMVVVLSELV
jgi:hypothetical protein